MTQHLRQLIPILKSSVIFLPILDAFFEKTDPTFTASTQETNPSSEHADWILKAYAGRAAQYEIGTKESYEIKSEDL